MGVFGYRSWREHGGASVSCGLGTGMPYRHAPVSTVSILHLDPTSTWRATSSARPTLDLRHATDFTIKVSRLAMTNRPMIVDDITFPGINIKRTKSCLELGLNPGPLAPQSNTLTATPHSLKQFWVLLF